MSIYFEIVEFPNIKIVADKISHIELRKPYREYKTKYDRKLKKFKYYSALKGLESKWVKSKIKIHMIHDLSFTVRCNSYEKAKEYFDDLVERLNDQRSAT